MNVVHATSQDEKPKLRRLYIFGAGGHGREIAWLAEQALGSGLELVFLVDQAAYLTAPVNRVPVRLITDVVVEVGDHFVVAVGDARLRRKAVAACTTAGLEPATLVHPRVEMSTRVALAQGAVICAGSVVTTNVEIGAHAHINIGCTISHDVQLGEYTSLSPGVHVSGHVYIGSDVFVGTGASIVNGSVNNPIVIGDGAIIAAGACVTRSVDPGVLVAGVPAVVKRDRASLMLGDS